MNFPSSLGSRGTIFPCPEKYYLNRGKASREAFRRSYGPRISRNNVDIPASGKDLTIYPPNPIKN
jgi:hypothetical protein